MAPNLSKQRLRFVTATSLFDGHDVSINIMRRMLQAQGAEVIHLGHNRSAHEVVHAALCEDAHAVAISSYQGGHMEYFRYVRKLLDDSGAQKIRIFGGGGGVITPKEIATLNKEKVARIYSPEDGMKLGLEGIIADMMKSADFDLLEGFNPKTYKTSTPLGLARCISYIENTGAVPEITNNQKTKSTPVLGITGTGGAGKSSLIDELFIRFHEFYPNQKIALVSVDPTRRSTQGALLGDRIRLGAAQYEQFFIRSLATRDSLTALSPHIQKVVSFLRQQDFSLILVESSGIGQSSDEITSVSDSSIYVMTPEYGAATQLEKIEMLEKANFVVLNKFEKPRAEDALRDIRKQYRRNHKLFHEPASDDALPVFGTCASRFHDPGVNALFLEILKNFPDNFKNPPQLEAQKAPERNRALIPPDRVNYLRMISKSVQDYKSETESLCSITEKYEKSMGALELGANQPEVKKYFEIIKTQTESQLVQNGVLAEVENFKSRVKAYKSGEYSYKVRDKEVKVVTQFESLSHSKISRVASPGFQGLSDLIRFIRAENHPGFFPFTSGIFPFKRKDEEPKRQFAGEGGPKRTNKRFHFLCEGDEFKRLSTAFDSATLYGADAHERPDIFGKVGESGVSICTLDDMKDLYDGFDLTDPKTSVSMTINGPAPMILALFMNTAIAQKLKGKDFWDNQKRIEIMRQVRGTVQADILKEDQAQNTCIFSLDFALRMMGDVQEYFSKNKIKNYYTVSISGYHIAEAGANPITQLAFTLANGFTYVEHYLSRGLKIDDFAENLSFFFSNGLDPEYSVIGRVARRIWAVAMKNLYGASEKSQKFKYHIQTSGRSLHAQEISFNDIRTTLQAFLALSDNCNSLHTNAYDEAITTPTEESVRRAMAIQMIINREFGINGCDNPLQGSFLIEELTDLVEEAVMREFEKLSDKGGVLGAMESTYQRSQIQEESLHYETRKDSGDLPIIGVNTFIAPDIDAQMQREIELSRASSDEKQDQINRLRSFQERNKGESARALEKLKEVARTGGNVFEELLNTVNFCSLGEMSQALYEVGGQYRRNL